MKLDPMERTNLTLSAGAVAVSFALAPPAFAWSLTLGAALEAVNFGALHRSARELFHGQVQGGPAWVALFALRFALLAPAIIVALWAGADPIGLVTGLSLAMPAMIWSAWRSRPPVLPADPELVVPAEDPSWDRYSVWLQREIDPKPEHLLRGSAGEFDEDFEREPVREQIEDREDREEREQR